MTSHSSQPKIVILLQYTLIIALALFLLYLGVKDRPNTPFLQRQLVSTGLISEQGLYLQPVRIEGHTEHWFDSKPKESNWILVDKIPLGDNNFYPVYYSVNGFQILRRNKTTQLFMSHGWLNKTSVFFVFDTGATSTLISDRETLAALSPQCESQNKTSSVDTIYTVCVSHLDTINLDGFMVNDTAEKTASQVLSYTHLPNWRNVKDKNASDHNLLGMNLIKGFNFVIKNKYLHLKPSNTQLFMVSPGIASLELTNANIQREYDH